LKIRVNKFNYLQRSKRQILIFYEFIKDPRTIDCADHFGTWNPAKVRRTQAVHRIAGLSGVKNIRLDAAIKVPSPPEP